MNTQIVNEIEKLFRIKADIKSALISKGRSPNDDFTTYANEIRAIVCNGNGTDTPDVPDIPDIPDIPDNPIDVNEYIEGYNWLNGDGSNYSVSFRPISGSNTFKSANITMRSIIKVDTLNPVGSTTSVFGSSGSINTIRHRLINLVIKALTANTFSIGYFSCASKDSALDDNNFVGNFNIGDTLVIEANENNIIINGVNYNNPVNSVQSMNLVNYHILNSGGSNGDRGYNAKLSKLEYEADGTIYSSVIPAKIKKELPVELSYDNTTKEVGTVGLWDTINNKFLTSNNINKWVLSN